MVLIDYWSPYQQIFIGFIQEFTSVTFQLVCLSRLGTDEILSNLILFLTLIIFAGPYLNIWITVIHRTCIKGDIKKYFPRAVFIMCMHLCGALLASVIVTNLSKDWSPNIIWKTRPVPNPSLPPLKFAWGVEFFEEMTAVLSLLIGCAYLFWLQKHEGIPDKIEELKKLGDTTPYFDINFFLRLTLLVASVSRAFPSAHLSFHISVYLQGMELTTWDQFTAHLLGGLVGVFITIVLVELRKYVYKKTPPARNPQAVGLLSGSITTNNNTKIEEGQLGRESLAQFKQNHYAPLRVSLHGGNYL